MNSKQHKVILLDVEGTTTPITFVHTTLFPYITSNVDTYLQSTWNKQQTQHDIDALIEYSKTTDTPLNDIDLSRYNESSASQVSALVKHLVSNDIKCTALKQLQGHMWRNGYSNNDYTGVMYDDVESSFKRWNSNHQYIYIYSSGSIEAQELIFRYSSLGDLKHYITGHFDTTSGHKRETTSYINIINAIKHNTNIELTDTHDILFCTDIYEEAVAADAAGMDVLIMIRPGNAALPQYHNFNTAHDFSAVL